MAQISFGKERIAIGWLAFWVAITGVALWFLWDSYFFATTREFWPGVTFWNRLVWYGAHAIIASPILLIAPVQFLAGLRKGRPEVHRWLGRIFLGSALIAAPLGIYLGIGLRNEGSRMPIVILGIVWFAVSAIAWQAARRKDFLTHRAFVIRSLAFGLAFVWIRVLDFWSDELLGYIPAGPVRQSTQEWIAFAMPLLACEAWLTWWPAWLKVVDRKTANT